MSLIVNMIPKPAEFTSRPDPSDKVAFGHYLVNAASCNDCHTPMEKGQYDFSRLLSGGNEFLLPDGSKVRSANLTPQHGTGIGDWTEERFISQFKAYADSSYQPHKLAKGEFNSAMPWIDYSAMSKEELSAIWAYLRTIPPVDNAVVKFTPAE